MAGNEADEFASFESLSFEDMESIMPSQHTFRDGDGTMEAFVRFCDDAAPKFPNVKTLRLSAYQLTERGLRALGTFLHGGYELKGLRTLIMTMATAGCDFNSHRREELLRFFRKIFQAGSVNGVTSLELHFRRTWLVDPVCETLAKLWESDHLSKLESLKLAVSGREMQWDSGGIVCLAKAFQSGHARKLKCLDLSGICIGDTGAKALAKAFDSGNLSSFEVLRLDTNDLTGVVHIFQSFESGKCPQIHELNLSGNNIEGAAAEALTKVLISGNLSNLGVLALKDSTTGPIAATAILQSLQFGKCPKLRTLDLSGNKFEADNQILLALATSLESGGMFNLKDILLFADMPISDSSAAGWKEIARVLGACSLPNLEHLIILRLPVQMKKLPTDVRDDLLNSYRKNPFLGVSMWQDEAWLDSTWEVGILVWKELANIRLRNQNRLEMMTRLQDEKDVSGGHGKVFICGDPGVGKTTLRKSMTKYRAQQATALCWRSQQDVREPTRGIEMASMKSEGVELVLWDLAGQHEYEVLHSAFLPDLDFADGQVTFFVIVCKANDFTVAREQLYYWLKFISSNTVEGTSDDKKRRVFVTANCFHGQKGGVRDVQDWNDLLADCQEDFAKFLNLQREPWIMDVTRGRKVPAFKKMILQEAQQVLQMRKMPQICLTIQEHGMQWVKGNEHYPVLTWDQYRLVVAPNCHEDKLAAAAEYLHDAGQIILSNNCESTGNSDGAAGTSRTAQDSLVIVNPQWFCQKVVGNLLLPDHMRKKDEDDLRFFLDKERGSIPISVLKGKRLDVPSNKVDEAIMVLSHCGICYRLPHRPDMIFIPALIQRTESHLPSWSNSSWRGDAGAWVMGFSLIVKNEKEAFLPIAALRHLQVDLAFDKDVGSKQDADYLATRSAISFKYQGMFVLIEYSEKKQDRMDVLVKPSVGTLLRKEQVNVAQGFVTRILNIVRGRCRNVELEKRIVEPWNVAKGRKPIEGRNIKYPVEEMKERVGRSGRLQTTEWTVGGERVEEEDILSDDDLQTFLSDISRREALTKEAVQWLTSSSTSTSEPDRGKGKESEPETSVVDLAPENSTISDPDLQAFAKQVDRRFMELSKKHDHMLEKHDHMLEKQENMLEKQENMLAMQKSFRALLLDVKGSIKAIVASQKSLNVQIQNLERFLEQDQEASVPRFAFLTRKGSPKWLLRLQIGQKETLVLHFLCEASHTTGTFHEVDGQEGVDVRRLEDWAKKLLPVLVWTLKVTFVAAIAAGNVVFPGLGILFNDGPLNNVFQRLVEMAPGVAESSKYLFRTLDDAFEQSLSEAFGEASLGHRSSNYVQGSELELRGDSRAAVRELLYQKMDRAERNRQLGLRRVRLEGTDSGGGKDIKWICTRCLDLYGGRASEF